MKHIQGILLLVLLSGFGFAEETGLPLFQSFEEFRSYCYTDLKAADDQRELMADEIIQNGLVYCSKVSTDLYGGLSKSDNENLDNYVKSVTHWFLRILMELRDQDKITIEQECRLFVEIMGYRRDSAFTAGRRQEALAVSRALIVYTEGTPLQLDVLRVAADMARFSGEPENAIAFLDKAVAQFKGWSHIKSYALNFSQTWALLSRARLCAEIGNLPKALLSYDDYFIQGVKENTLDYFRTTSKNDLQKMTEIAETLGVLSTYSSRISSYQQQADTLIRINENVSNPWPPAANPAEVAIIGTEEQINLRIKENYTRAHDKDDAN